MKYFKNTSWRGFTLIELLVVISIIGVLAAFVATAVFNGRSQARDVSRTTDLEQIKLGLRLYKEAYGEYPDYPEGVEIGVGELIDSDLEPFIGEVGDPLSGEEPGGAYGYWYSSNLNCGGESKVAVMAVSVESEKFANYDDVCGSSDSSQADSADGFVIGSPNDVTEVVGKDLAAQARGFDWLNWLCRKFGLGCNNNSSNDGTDFTGSCNAPLSGSNICRFGISASQTSLPEGGGRVTLCWAYDTNNSDPPRRAYGGELSWSGGSESGVRERSQNVNVNQTTTFYFDGREDAARGGNSNRVCPAASITVLVADDSEEEIQILGCTDEDAYNYNSEANTDDDSCGYREDSDTSESPVLFRRFDRVLIVQ